MRKVYLNLTLLIIGIVALIGGVIGCLSFKPTHELSISGLI